jgi:predicted transcriptional regulator
MAPRSTGDRDEDAVRRFIENFAMYMADSGMPRMASRVFLAVLCSENGRLTAPQLAETLQVSPAAISGALRYLGQVGLLFREREPGYRKDHYRVGDDVWYEVFAHREHLLAQWETNFTEGVDAVGADTRAGRRLAESRDFFAFLRKEMPGLLDRWRAQREKEQRRRS